MPQWLKEKLYSLLWRVLLAVERAEAILDEPLHPPENIDIFGELENGIERPEERPEQAE